MRRTQFAIERPAILVVDDEQHILNAIDRLLTRYGVVVHKATGPDVARELLQEIEVQVVCSDIKMGKENGISFLKWVREHHPKLQRILLTAFASQPEYLADAINQAGVHRFLAKPFDPLMLLETVKQSVEQWATVAERDGLLAVTARQNESLLRLNAELENANADLESKVAQRTQQIADANQMWRRTFDSISDPMTVVDEQFRIRRANRAAAQLAVLDDVRMLMGQTCHEALFDRPEQCDYCPLKDRIGPAEWTDERDGRHWSASVWQMQGEGEGRAWSVCHYTDVTEQKRIQDEMMRREQLLELGKMSARVAHEVNNPMTGVLAMGQLLARGLDAPHQREMADDIVVNARRCSDIIRQLLDFSRQGRGAGRELLAIPQVFADCESMIRFQLPKQAEVELTFDADPQLMPVRGKRQDLHSLVRNLVINAAQAMEMRGQIEVRAVPLEAGVRITVADTGPGVPVEVMDEIFEPFFTTKAANRQGTGLGLAIVRDIVRDHGGTVQVENLPEHGARFTVDLPTTAE